MRLHSVMVIEVRASLLASIRALSPGSKLPLWKQDQPVNKLWGVTDLLQARPLILQYWHPNAIATVHATHVSFTKWGNIKDIDEFRNFTTKM